MQKKLIALAVIGLAAAPAFAESANVTIYGTLDQTYGTYTHDASAGHVNDYTGSALGFTGEEDLGGGLKAFFKLEERFNPDTGKAKSTMRWEEISFLGLKGNFGEAIIGRVPGVLDTIGPDDGAQDTAAAHWVGDKKGDQGRVPNAVRYTSPMFGPVQLVAGYGLSESNHDTLSTSTGVVNYRGAGLTATFGQLLLGVAAEHNQNQNNAWQLSAKYDFGVASVNAVFTHAKQFAIHGAGDTNNKSNNLHIGALIPLPNATLGLVYRRLSGQFTNGGEVQKLKAANEFGVSYQYFLSKRTSVLAGLDYAHQNKDGFAYGSEDGATVASGFSGSNNSTGVSIGLRHKF